MDQFGGIEYWRGVSAANLTGPGNGTIISRARDVVPGCTIGLYDKFERIDNVMVVYSVDKDTLGRVFQINYRHSVYVINAPQDRVVHGTIKISDDFQNLNHSSAIWSDGYAPGNFLKATM